MRKLLSGKNTRTNEEVDGSEKMDHCLVGVDAERELLLDPASLPDGCNWGARGGGLKAEPTVLTY